MKKRVQILFFTCWVLLWMAQNKVTVCANVKYSPDKVALSMQSVGDSEEYDERGIEISISKVNPGAVIRVESDNTNIVGFSYEKDEDDEEDEEDEEDESDESEELMLTDVDSLKITGKADRLWNDHFIICSRRSGTCNVTVYVNDKVDKTWKVTVKPTKPGVSLESKEIWGSDDTTLLKFNKLSKFAEVTLKSSKPLALVIGDTYDGKAQKIVLKNKNKKISGEKLTGDVSIDTAKYPVSGGKRKITVKIKQDNKTYNYVLKLNVKTYTSPYQSFKIGSVDFTKTLKKHRHISDTIWSRVSVKTAKKTIDPEGKKGKTFVIKMKDGYKVENIEYKEKDNWTSNKRQYFSVKSGVVTGKLDPAFWELYIYYKKGTRIECTQFNWSSMVFAD